MDTHELNVWNKLFSSALDIAGASPGTTHDTLNVLLSKISDVLQWVSQIQSAVFFFHALVSGYSLKTCTTLLPLLLPHLHFDPSNTLHLELLDVINGSLVKMYPPTSEDIVVALPILKGVARALERCESENTVKFLVILKDGLGLWIRDEARALPESDHSSIVRCSLICFHFTWTPFLWNRFIQSIVPPSLCLPSYHRLSIHYKYSPPSFLPHLSAWDIRP